jgi:hypothetical protein
MDLKYAKKLVFVLLISSITLYLLGWSSLSVWWFRLIRQFPLQLYLFTAHTAEFLPIFFAVCALAAGLYWQLSRSLLRMTCLILSFQVFAYFMYDHIDFWYWRWSNPDSMCCFILRWTLWQALSYSAGVIVGIWLFYKFITRKQKRGHCDFGAN